MGSDVITAAIIQQEIRQQVGRSLLMTKFFNQSGLPHYYPSVAIANARRFAAGLVGSWQPTGDRWLLTGGIFSVPVVRLIGALFMGLGGWPS